MQDIALLPLGRVLAQVGIGHTEVYEEMKDGSFPRAIKVGRRSLWLESEIDAWIDAAVSGIAVNRVRSHARSLLSIARFEHRRFPSVRSHLKSHSNCPNFSEL